VTESRRQQGPDTCLPLLNRELPKIEIRRNSVNGQDSRFLVFPGFQAVTNGTGQTRRQTRRTDGRVINCVTLASLQNLQAISPNLRAAAERQIVAKSPYYSCFLIEFWILIESNS
jgi:hypothetical protein